MGEIVFEGAAPFEMALQRPPVVNCEGENLLLVLPVFVPESSTKAIGVRVYFSIAQAEQLVAQMQEALAMARLKRGVWL